MGISGYALQRDAVCFVNDFIHKTATMTGPPVAQLASSGATVLSPAQQAEED